jgi:uncharacterized NAD(P)/FAD-binding protein YdhS
MVTVAIVGGGFSGTLVALHLLRRSPADTRLVLIERNSQFGRGLAYGTGNANHILNVPAGRMSAFHDRPGDFLEWLRAQPEHEGGGEAVTAATFAPRQAFGSYVRALLNAEVRNAKRDRLDLVRGQVERLDREGHPLVLHLDRGRTVQADYAVLAIGNFPPEPMPVETPEFYDTPFYRPDPWSPDAFANLPADAPVLLIGTGLTMVDGVVSLLDQGHTGPIYAVSRRGLLPRRHETVSRPAPEHAPFPTGLRDLTAFLRSEAGKALRLGGGWQPIIDELRPFTVDIWQAMSLPDRRRFLRHLRPWWDVHRHRMAGQVADRIDAARASGQLRITVGRVRAYHPKGDRVEVQYRPRGSDTRLSLMVARVVSCSGPGADYDRIQEPLIRNLLKEGVVRPDKLRLGLDVTGTCALLNASGAISRRIFSMGPVTKGTFWEMVAVPDLRRQAEFLAEHLSNLIRAAPQRVA